MRRGIDGDIHHVCTILMGYPSGELIVQSSWGRYQCFGGGKGPAGIAQKIHSVRRESQDEANYESGSDNPEIVWRSNLFYVETTKHTICLVQVVLVYDHQINTIPVDESPSRVEEHTEGMRGIL